MKNFPKVVIGAMIGAIILSAAALIPLPTGGLGSRDLLPYWAAAHLLSLRNDPYDLTALRQVEQVVAPERDEVDPAWNPPWLFVLLLPIGLLPFAAAVRVWLVLNMLVLGLLPLAVWRMYSGPVSKWPPVWLSLLGLGFAPALTTIAIGQVATLVLLGLVVSLVGLQSRQDRWAGAALVLLLVKPQLFYLVTPLLLLWTTLQRRWQVWLGLLLTLTAALVAATILSPEWLSGYIRLVGRYDFFKHSAATIGGFAQAYFSTDIARYLGVLALLFIPLLIRLLNRQDVWAGVNAALLISLPLAPYGWSFDQIVLIPAIVQIIFWLQQFSIRRRRWYTLGLIGIYLAALILKSFGTGDFWFVWIALAVGGLYAAVYVERRREYIHSPLMSATA